MSGGQSSVAGGIVDLSFRVTAAMAAALLLGACGGGGGGPRPEPTPLPPPAPPPPPPPPPPPAFNESLLDLRASQSFDNDAATATGIYNEGGTCNSCTSQRSSLTVRYDAAARSYTVSTDGRSQTFGQPDIDTAQSTPELQVFSRKEGSLTQSLSLTRPGTSGPLNYRYVGLGVWQRVNVSGSRADFSFDSFTYGLPTQAAATPRSGVGVYDVALIGALGTTTRSHPISLSGTGKLTADFARGDILLSGSIVGTSAETRVREFNSTFDGSARIASGTNSFSGTMRFFGSSPMTGTLDGRFFGPAAEEVGATFAVNGP